jgi:hypothetical protein
MCERKPSHSVLTVNHIAEEYEPCKDFLPNPFVR